MKSKQLISIILLILLGFSFVYVGCGDEPPHKVKDPIGPVVNKKEIESPAFNADSSFQYVKKQVDFGPRVPNSQAHTACGNWLVSELKKRGASVTEQNTQLKAFDGTLLSVRNVIASFQPEKKNRVLLCAHWDTRPFGDKDPNQKLWGKPIDGANDGASGVGVLLEIARIIQLQPTEIGIDVIFFDAEDYGTSEFQPKDKTDILNPDFITSWCLGSQYWGFNKHVSNYNPRFGILLDMVGAADAQFNQEKYSIEAGADVVNLVWNTGAKMGFGYLFQDREIDGVVDDHFMVSRSGIRCIDIIDTRLQVAAMGLGGYQFASYHHTHKDNIDIIDKNTLKGVGQTLLQVIYNQ